MQPVSNAYKDYLKQDFLDANYHSQLTLGVINREAQKNAIVLDTNITDFSEVNVFDGKQEQVKYGSYEKDRVLADGSFSFLPPTGPYFWTGITSNQLSDNKCNIDTYITINNDTGVPLDAKGITLQFDDVYPVDFCLIDGGSKVLDVIGNNQLTYINSDVVYTLDTNLTLKITKLNKPHSRFRVVSIKFGVALSFGTDDIQSMTYKEQLQLISSGMYASDLSVIVGNGNQRFNLDNPSSEINFLEQAQLADASVSINLPNGMVETIKLGTFYLADWSAKLDTATFKLTDIFNFMSGTYSRGVYRSDGISLYDLSIDVLTDAGLTPDKYVIDTYLKTIYINNPIPVLSHKDALQLIANAGRCILKQDRDGRICMRAAFVPDTKLQSNDILTYANLSDIINGQKKEVYGTYEKNFTPADGTNLFLPSDKSYLDVGYISQSLSDINCMYGSKPHILIDFEAPVSLYNINLLFGPNIASDFVITTYQGTSVVETIAFTDNDDRDFRYNYPFKVCNRLLIIFIKSNKPLQRVYIHGISFSTITDKAITYDDIKVGTLQGAKQERVKNLTVLRTIYTPSGVDETQDIRVTKVAGDSPETIISFQAPMATARLLLVGVDVMQSMSAWQATAHLTVPNEGSVEYVLQLTGRKLNKITQNLVFPLNPTGSEKVVENALVSDYTLAHDLGEWVADYLMADKEYNFDYWFGDASLDTNDIIRLENKYNDKLQVQIYSHELQIAGSITGKAKARKVVYDG